MKTTIFAYVLMAGATLFGTACSTTGTGAGSGSGAATTSGSGAGAGMGTTSGSSATGAGNSGAGTGGVGASSGASAAGTSGTSGASAASGTTAVTGAGAAGSAGGTSGTGGGPTDMTAFMSTFATMPDATFLLTAASSNLLEIQAGQMAAQKAASPSVKKFAQMMVDHHTKATQQLTAIATPLGVSPSQTLMPVHQAMLDQLTTKSGKQFDEGYMDAMETAHTMDVAMFEVKDKAAETPTVKAFATKTLPMLRSHRKMAGELESKVD